MLLCCQAPLWVTLPQLGHKGTTRTQHPITHKIALCIAPLSDGSTTRTQHECKAGWPEVGHAGRARHVHDDLQQDMFRLNEKQSKTESVSNRVSQGQSASAPDDRIAPPGSGSGRAGCAPTAPPSAAAVVWHAAPPAGPGGTNERHVDRTLRCGGVKASTAVSARASAAV